MSWSVDDRLSIDKEPAHNYRICLNEFEFDLSFLEFKKYIDKFLKEEYKKKDYINAEDFKKIFASYDNKKDDIESLYRRIGALINKKYTVSFVTFIHNDKQKELEETLCKNTN